MAAPEEEHASLEPSAAAPEEEEAKPAASSGRGGGGRGRGRARGKAKAKGKAKGKAKAKAKAAAAPADGEGAAEGAEESKPKVKKLSLTAQVHKELECKDIEEVKQDATNAVSACQEEIEKAEDDLRVMDSKVEEAKKAMVGKAQNVEMTIERELAALEKLRTSRLAITESVKKLAQAKLDHENCMKKVSFLEWESATKNELSKLEEVRKAAVTAAEDAKKDLEEAKAKAIKALEEEQTQGSDKESIKARKVEEKQAAKKMLAEVGEFEKARIERNKAREKVRQQLLKEAAGLGRTKRLRDASAAAAASPPVTKARMQDVTAAGG